MGLWALLSSLSPAHANPHTLRSPETPTRAVSCACVSTDSAESLLLRTCTHLDPSQATPKHSPPPSQGLRRSQVTHSSLTPTSSFFQAPIPLYTCCLPSPRVWVSASIGWPCHIWTMQVKVISPDPRCAQVRPVSGREPHGGPEGSTCCSPNPSSPRPSRA